MDELVNVYAKTEDGWKLVFKDIPEDIASGIWRAGFKTGENNISIERKGDREFFKRQIEKLHRR
jgi:hypothetical protein